MKNGKKDKEIPGSFSKEIWFLGVCKLLNQVKAKYLVLGGWACNLHGLVRATKDIDLLIPKDIQNTELVLQALENLTFGIAKELDAEEVTRKPFTIIGDTPRVDLLTVAGKINYPKAARTSLKIKIDEVEIPYVDLETLLKTKQTDRLQDKADIERLKQIRKMKKE